MKILILTTHLDPGGISRYVLNLANGLAGKGHTVYIASRGGEWEEKLAGVNPVRDKSLTEWAFSNGVKHIPVPLFTKFIFSPRVFKSYVILKEFLRHSPVDIIHANTRVSQFLAWLLWRKLKIAYICSFHGFYRRHLFRRILKFPGLNTIVPSRQVKEHLVNDFGFSADKVKVIPHGIDFSKYPSSRIFGPDPELRRKYGLGTKRVLGVVARFVEEKNLDVVIKGFKQVQEVFPDSRLALLGRGRLKSSLEHLAASLGINRQVIFIEDMPSDKFFRLIDTLILASSKEGFGLVLIEAQAYGLPVIGSDTGGIKEIIKDGETGLLLKEITPEQIKEKVIKIFSDKHLREKLKNSSLACVKEKFSLERMLSRTLEVYSQFTS